MKNMIIGQSGGPSPAINASLAGAVQHAMASDKIGKVYGMLHGLQGLLERQIVCISDQMTHAKDFEQLAHTPAMALGSCRFKLSKTPDENYQKVLDVLREYNVGYFFYCGGNDSMDTINNLSKFFREKGEEIICVGIPKTVDNDLAVTDHTPGFGSAAKYVATSVAEAMIDAMAYPIPSVTIFEVMGRNAGWLTAAAALARGECFKAPHLIYLPEVMFDADMFTEQLREILKTEKYIVVAVSEGIKWKETGRYVAEKEGGVVDMFGHPSLGGVADVIAAIAKERLGVRTRVIQPGVMQRVGIHIGSGVDIREALDVGVKAVEFALDGITDVMVSIRRVSNHPYLVQYETAPLTEVANHERKVPLEWITNNGSDVSEEMLEYLRPLFRGKVDVHYQGGLPQFFSIDRSKLVEP